ncbi:PAN2-PAN3 deadenylation complex catalytic subunit Pan2-like isoform X1 [Octopus vulgaris]|uniref:PAN2-PAN3 deadenylation complex catalytic subunit Pan2-like isoform X1 n=2 Tax=Octopus TaxID=6643 RepID=A0AA36F860_OCTVU|nr:PAN2-PAN3 deadenylation complex catalytic subunit Pan2 [Octopus sinensis]XP_029640692.1 PAN2-PAN3 deadenylation complex catalytic subunit Pan2 [Octopus sinensis]XP_036361962.1 PAN2-PAN3 deadenylation complex catalytic subunit Pan2 [Octopus sinensis]XP_036361963.1 PAN2-PAN3 deadenylation complex catalytic subunit Pan2 [Octopus sinensis]CAI9729366.1 PAN2-PAN3 deadenylation complex catalytic subunit Pan2-like isoform X1 [Octopus vulgaris]
MEYPGVSVGFPNSVVTSTAIPIDTSLMETRYSENLYQPEHHNSGDVQFSETHSVLADAHHFGVSSLSFDLAKELLWMGTQGGHVTSYYGAGLEKYTSFQVHSTDEIRQILSMDTGCLYLTRNNLRCSMRTGLKQFDYIDEYMEDMQCILMTSPETVLMGGHQTKVIELDLNKLQKTREVDVDEPGCAIFRASNKFICAGDISGKLTLYDHKTLNAEHVLEAHTGTLSDFDINGNLLVTCGYSNRMGNLAPDRFLMVYDLRFIRAMAPIKVVIDPAFLRFLPAYPNKLCVVSQVGHFQVLDTTTMAPGSMMLYQVDTQGGVLMSFDVSPTCQSMAFGDSTGYIHLFSTSEQAAFNAYPEQPEFADPVEPVTPMHINDELAPLSIIPMTYPSGVTLLSDWPAQLCQKVYRAHKPVEPELLRTMKMRHNVGYAPNPGTTHRNQVPYDLKNESNNYKSIPESSNGRDDNLVNIPKRYRKVEIKYSKLGIDDFEFRYYNKTNFAGLETQIPNAYCNGMLQVLYFIEPLRCAMKSHLCEREFCLACELGFLFHMLDEQKGQTCQANNFLRAFRTIPEASALELIIGDHDQLQGKANFTRLIQNWQRFLHQQVHSEYCVRGTIYQNAIPEGAIPVEGCQQEIADYYSIPVYTEPCPIQENIPPGANILDQSSEAVPESPPKSEPEVSIVSQLFGIEMETLLRCRCGHETHRTSYPTLTNLSYPSSNTDEPPQVISFSNILLHSLTSEQVMQAWCSVCSRYQTHVQKKLIKSLPDIIALNCGLDNPRDIEFWKTQLQIIKKDSTEQKEEIASPKKKLCRYGKLCKRKDCFFRHEPNPQSYDQSSDGGDSLNEENSQSSYVPTGLRLSLSNNVFSVNRLTEEAKTSPPDEFSKDYEIYATVSHIKDGKTSGNLVSCVKVGKKYHQRKEKVTCTQWYLFNDFSITPIEMSEALHFDMDWKIPCIIYFTRKNINQYHDITVQNPITSEVLLDQSGVVNPKITEKTFIPLTPDEIPKRGSLVALDAEFVSLDQEQAELKSDGTRSTLKPSHLALARLTCVRGYGPLHGEPFIDDYIAMQEQVVDYLTEYSGIKPDDLIASVSTKHLTTLKSTYMKLRYLVDQGVCFVGHGLKKDFRVINISVPKKQIVDTVELLRQPRQRNISLKFLVRYFLKMDIQSFTHDSIEDARSALRLYRLYEEMAKKGENHIKNVIKNLYEYGRKVQWKLPPPEELAEAMLPVFTC